MPFPWEVEVAEDGTVHAVTDNPLMQQAARNQAELASVGAIDPALAEATTQIGASMFPPGLAPAPVDTQGLPDYLTNPNAYVTPPGGLVGLNPDGSVPANLNLAVETPPVQPDPGDGNPPLPPPVPELELAEHTKLKCPKCDTVQSASNKKCTNCGHNMKKARGAKFAKLNAGQDRMKWLRDHPDATHQAIIYNTQGLNLAVAKDNLLWKVACKTGTLALSPGPGQTDVEKPLVLDDELFNDMVLSAEEQAFPYITVPETHANGSLENTGYVRAWEVLGKDELLADQRLPEKHRPIVEADPDDTRYLMAGIEFTEPEVKAKAERGSIPDSSIGVKFNYRNKRTGKLFRAAWEHLALTPMPWVDGLPAFGLSQRNRPFDGSLEASYDGVYLPLELGIQARVTADGNRYEWDITNVNPVQVRADIEQAISVIDSDSKLEMPFGVCIQRYDEYWVISSDYDKIAGIRQNQADAVDLAMATLKDKYNLERDQRKDRRSEAAIAGSSNPLPPWPDEDAGYSQQPGEESLELSVIHFDPNAHPRDWKGRFRSALAGLSVAGDEVVSMPDGTRVGRNQDGYQIVKVPDDAMPTTIGNHVGSVDEVVGLLESSPDVHTPDELPGKRFSDEDSNGIESVQVAEHIDAMKDGDSFTIQDAEDGDDWLVTKHGDDWTVDDNSGRPYEAGTRNEVLEHLGLDPQLAAEQTMEFPEIGDLSDDELKDEIAAAEHTRTRRQDAQGGEFGARWSAALKTEQRLRESNAAGLLFTHYDALAGISHIGGKLPEGYKVKKTTDAPDHYDLKRVENVQAVTAPDGTLLGYVGKVNYDGERVMSGRIQVGTTGAGKRWAAFTETGKQVQGSVHFAKNRFDALRSLGRYHPTHGKDQRKRMLSQDAPNGESKDLSLPGDSASLPADSEQTSPTGDTEHMPRGTRTVEDVLASQQADLEAAQSRIADLESELSLSQGVISTQGQQLHKDAVSKRVRQLQGAGYPPVLCLAVKSVMEGDKTRLLLAGKEPDDKGHVEGGLNLSVSKPVVKDGEETIEAQVLQTPTDVAEFLLSAFPVDTENAAALLASVSNDLGELHLSQHDEKNDEEKGKAAVDEWEREHHPERFDADGKRL